MNTKETVYVGISGGVDSAVTALLLQNQGYEVIGVYISINILNEMQCSNNFYKNEAMKVCAKLKIPFLIYDATIEYKKYVLNYFIEGYRTGITPNPDVFCNKFIKFNFFIDFVDKQFSGSKIAMGHYATLETVGQNQPLIKIPKDKQKDQTYFLCHIDKDILNRILFPLSGLTKTKVRKIAKKNNLPSSELKDSVGICFIGNISIPNFLAKFIDLKKGDVVCKHTSEIVGRHSSVFLYTLLQRHGFDLNKPIGPMYVIGKDLEKNILYVSDKNNINKYCKTEYELTDINKFTDCIPEDVLIRYRHRGSLIRAKFNNDMLILEKPVLIASGQLIAIYVNEFLIAGGVVV